MKTRCRGCRKLIPYGNTYCEDCNSTILKRKKEDVKQDERRNAIEKTTKSSRWKALRKAVLLRDKCCILCFNKYHYINAEDLQVHHIVKRVDDESLIYEPSNLVSLCRDCHEEVEKLKPTEQRKILGEYNKEINNNFKL